MPVIAEPVLRQAELTLARDRPFGDSADILNRCLTFYLRSIRALQEHVAGAASFLHAFELAPSQRKVRVLSDPASRARVNEAIVSLRAGAPPTNIVMGLSEALESTRDLLALGVEVDPLERHASKPIRVGDGASYAWIWSADRSPDPLGSFFQDLFEVEIATSISSSRAALRDPDHDMSAAIANGSDLLRELLPDLSTGVLAHVQLIGIVDVADESARHGPTRIDLCQNVSTHAIPGTIFLSPSPLRSAWHAAEALLHEGLHKKLSDLVLTRSIFRRGFSAASSRTIRAVWNPPLSWNPNDWSIDRALFAFHVYVHLALFFATALTRADLISRFGPPEGMNLARLARGAMERARYLGTGLREDSAAELGDDGYALLEWLSGVLAMVDPTPPISDPSVQLSLDRYDRETRRVARILSSLTDSDITRPGSLDPEADGETWGPARIVDHLIQSEIVAVYRILATVGELSPPTFAFYDANRWSAVARSELDPASLADAFRTIRTFTSSVLRGLPETYYDKTCLTRRTKTVRDLVEGLVEHAGPHIETLMLQSKRKR
jgi:hypothetical protein